MGDRFEPRLRDLEQLEVIASRYRSRQRMLLEMTLDPPSSTQDLAGPPTLDDDYLVLSTIHSAKGLEWDLVLHLDPWRVPSKYARKAAALGDATALAQEWNLKYVCETRTRHTLIEADLADFQSGDL